MIKKAAVLIVAEIGPKVGWGHLARCALLKNILATHFSVSLKVVNREAWKDAFLKKNYALSGTSDADLVFYDGLSLKREAEQHVTGLSTASLSYISDINDTVDVVIAPSLHGMTASNKTITDLAALLCNMPNDELGLELEQSPSYDQNLIGVCMGGGDVDGVTPAITHKLNELGYTTRVFPHPRNRQICVDGFLHQKLSSKALQPFPYEDFKNCAAVICQGGLSAVEFALMGIPTVIRRRSDFSEAYRFLQMKGCSKPSSENSIPSLIDALELIIKTPDLRRQMSVAGRSLYAQIDDCFWLNLIQKIRVHNDERMPLLQRK